MNTAGIVSSVLTVGLWTALLVPSWGMTHFSGEWDNVPPSVRQWYNAQTVPGTSSSCCSQADATSAEEDRSGGHYIASFNACDQATCVRIENMQVPDAAVLKNYRPTDPQIKLPVVWWGIQEGQYFIRCYAPEPDARLEHNGEDG